MRVRVEFIKGDRARHISHLDLLRTWERAMRRAGLPVAMSQGFNPHPKMVPASSLPVGQTSRAEIMEVVLSEPVSPAEFVRRINAAMPDGLRITRAKEVPAEAGSPAALVSGAVYEARPWGEARSSPHDEASEASIAASAVTSAVERFLAADEVRISRETEKGRRETDLRPLVHGLRWEDGRLTMALAAGREGTARPSDLLTAMGFDPSDWNIERIGLFKVTGPDPTKWIAAWDL